MQNESGNTDDLKGMFHALHDVRWRNRIIGDIRIGKSKITNRCNLLREGWQAKLLYFCKDAFGLPFKDTPCGAQGL